MSERITVTLSDSEAKAALVAYVEQKHGTLKSPGVMVRFSGEVLGRPGLAISSVVVTGLKS